MENNQYQYLHTFHFPYSEYNKIYRDKSNYNYKIFDLFNLIIT
jgi:hypothetical protein